MSTTTRSPTWTGTRWPLWTARARRRREGVALHVLHDDVVALLARADLEDGDDVRVVDPRGEARLLEEHLDELGLAREVGVKALDRDEALKAADAGEAPEVHGGHPAGRELGDELEAVEPSVLAFDGNELGAQGSSRAKCMGIIMTSCGALEGSLETGPADPEDGRHPRTRGRASRPGRRRRWRPLREEESHDRSGGCDTARDADDDVGAQLVARPLMVVALTAGVAVVAADTC